MSKECLDEVFSATGEPLRIALARYLADHEDELRRIARRKLNGSPASSFDSADVASSVVRRIDGLVTRGRLRARSEAELWALIRRIVENTTISKLRLAEVAARHLGEDSEYARLILDRLRSLETDDEATLLVLRMATSLDDATDRQILLLRLRGSSHRAAAGFLGSTEDAVKARWHRIRVKLADQFGTGAFDG